MHETHNDGAAGSQADWASERLRRALEEAEQALVTAERHRQVAAEALADIQAKATAIAAAAQEVEAARTSVVTDQQEVVRQSANIQAAFEHADRIRMELDQRVSTANQQTNDIDAQKLRAQTAADSANEYATAARVAAALVDANLSTVAIAKDAATEATGTLKGLAEKAASDEERLNAYELALSDLQARCSSQLDTIDRLLPGATSAGLASAFDLRRQSFLRPGTRWQWVFFGSVSLLALLAFSGMWHVYQGSISASYEELLRLWMVRFPVAAALVWMAIHASHESALAKRMEEDYGYKAAIASTFLGFQKQMSEIAATAGDGTPLAKLCGDTLATIASPPGRIYDKHGLAGSPKGELKDMFKSIKDPSN